MASVVSLLFAFGGTPGFFSIAAEMKNPLDYNKAMFCCQGFSIALYNSVSIVLWFYAGRYVTSPALGSAGPLIKKIAYGSWSFLSLFLGPRVFVFRLTVFPPFPFQSPSPDFSPVPSSTPISLSSSASSELSEERTISRTRLRPTGLSGSVSSSE
jgi:hypothetical protein